MSAMRSSSWLDPAFVAGELVARHVYWRSPSLVRLLGRYRNRRRPATLLDRSELRGRLSELGVREGGLALVHSSIAGLALPGPGNEPAIDNPLLVGSQLLGDLRALLGAEGTLAMPTHPLYRGDTEFLSDKSSLFLEYEPARTPSSVGIMTELLRRKRGCQRSRHPLSSLACLGPLAAELLHENLNERSPLPHGVDSPYYRICRLGGVIVSIGVPLIKSITCIHVAEEVRDAEWPVRDFFYPRRFNVREGSEVRAWTVRERRPEFVRSLALSVLRRDLLREGILVETDLGGVPVHAAAARGVLEYMLARNSRSPYPYVLPKLSRW